MATTPSGEIKRSISFDMAKDSHRALYEFSRSLNLSEFVRQALAAEMRRRTGSSGAATIVLAPSAEAEKSELD
jgi:hypothetical protein